MKCLAKVIAALMAGTSFLVGAFSGCSSSDAGESAYTMTAISRGTLQVSEIAHELVDSTATDVSLVRLDDSAIPSYYSFDASLVEDAVVYMSANSSCADEIAVFQMAEGEDETPVISAVNSRVQSKERAFRNISPTEHEKMRNAVQVNISDYIVLAITPYPDTARSVIAELFYVPIYRSDSTTVASEK